MAKAKAAPAGDNAEPKSKKKLMMFAIVGVVALAAGGGGAWFFMSKNDDGHKQEAKHEPPAPPVFMAPETFTVNLQPDGEEQYLQVGLVVQVKDQEASERMKQYMPQIRSRMLMLLSSKKASEIMDLQGKNKLIEEIIAQLKQPFVQGEEPLQVSSVHFTDFIIQ
ncbi:MAG: flagellar basal body-associated protein FliL [Hydrogenophilaceae bacterium]|nr:flagellar basal body-associated protein FliL [Hydrogenophilaceae bacterium]